MSFLIGINMQVLSSQRGFILPLSVLVAALMLSIGLALASVTIRQVILTSISTGSHKAFYAADAALECALYWDLKESDEAVFGVPGTNDPNVPNSGRGCGDRPSPTNDITASGTAWTTVPQVGGTAGPASSATFDVFYQNSSCARVSVNKVLDSNVVQTTVVARGFSSCAPEDLRRVERGIRITY